MITFQYPWMLLSLLAVPFLFWRFLTRRRPGVVISNVLPARKIAPVRRKLDFPELCILIAVLLLSFALHHKPFPPAVISL